MHSGGGLKESPYHFIYIEAPEKEACVIFYNRFGHSPSRVSCTCCGDDYSVSENKSLAQLTGFHRGCKSLQEERGEDGRYIPFNEQPQWFQDHYYLEPGEEKEAKRRGFRVDSGGGSIFAKEHKTVEEYEQQEDVLFIRASEIAKDERVGDVPEQGFIWHD
jgi:hypothetical protein